MVAVVKRSEDLRVEPASVLRAIVHAERFNVRFRFGSSFNTSFFLSALTSLLFGASTKITATLATGAVREDLTAEEIADRLARNAINELHFDLHFDERALHVDAALLASEPNSVLVRAPFSSCLATSRLWLQSDVEVVAPIPVLGLTTTDEGLAIDAAHAFVGLAARCGGFEGAELTGELQLSWSTTKSNNDAQPVCSTFHDAVWSAGNAESTANLWVTGLPAPIKPSTPEPGWWEQFDVLTRNAREALTELHAHLLAQEPYIETTTRYAASKAGYGDLGLTPEIGAFFSSLAQTNSAQSTPEDSRTVLFPSMYAHQERAFREFLVERKDIVVATGTGSGKTECFLVPMLGSLYDEAVRSPKTFEQPGVRALILYPMNALVNDQLSRLRLLLGDPAVADAFKELGENRRFPRFGMYTGRTPYPGPRMASRDSDRVKPLLDYYLGLSPEVEERLRRLGRYPAKNLHSFYAQHEARRRTYRSGKRTGQEYTDHNWDQRLHTGPEDRELLTRQEMVHGAGSRPGHAPDVLVIALATHELRAQSNLSAMQYLYPAVVHLCAHRGYDLFPAADEIEFHNHLGQVKGKTLQQTITMANKGWLRATRSFAQAIFSELTDRYYSLPALALATVEEDLDTAFMIFDDFPNVGLDADAQKVLFRAWLRQHLERRSFRPDGAETRELGEGWAHPQGINAARIEHVLPNRFDQYLAHVLGGDTAKVEEVSKWFQHVVRDKGLLHFESDLYYLQLQGLSMSLRLDSNWLCCRDCARIHPEVLADACPACLGTVMEVDADYLDARTGFYRHQVQRAFDKRALEPFGLSAAEHSAQLTGQPDESAFNKVEEYELRFQDVPLGNLPPIDVLSCTTTMEVGIDIGALSGVALRNVPPHVANYQQRAGRAGRRGRSIASVITYAHGTSHDAHFFDHPEQIISGDVRAPVVYVENQQVLERHIHAYLVQRFFHERVPPDPTSYDLFGSLGTVEQFLSEAHPCSLLKLEAWLDENADLLRDELQGWVPAYSFGLNEPIAEVNETILRAIDRSKART